MTGTEKSSAAPSVGSSPARTSAGASKPGRLSAASVSSDAGVSCGTLFPRLIAAARRPPLFLGGTEFSSGTDFSSWVSPAALSSMEFCGSPSGTENSLSSKSGRSSGRRASSSGTDVSPEKSSGISSVTGTEKSTAAPSVGSSSLRTSAGASKPGRLSAASVSSEAGVSCGTLFPRLIAAARSPPLFLGGTSGESASDILYESGTSRSSRVLETSVIEDLLCAPVSVSTILAESLLSLSRETVKVMSGSPFGCSRRLSICRVSTYSASSIFPVSDRYKSTIIRVWLLWAVVRSSVFS